MSVRSRRLTRGHDNYVLIDEISVFIREAVTIKRPCPRL